MYTAQSEQAERDWIACGIRDMKGELDNILVDIDLKSDKAVHERLKRLSIRIKHYLAASAKLRAI